MAGGKLTLVARRRARPKKKGRRAIPLSLAIPSKRRISGPRYMDSLFPLKWRLKHKYVGQFPMATFTADLPAHKYISCVSMYDPEVSTGGTNHQVRNYDTLASLYHHYRVEKATIKVNFSLQVDIDTVTPVTCFLLYDTDVSSLNQNEFTAMAEVRGAKYRNLNVTNRQATIISTYNAKKVYGGQKFGTLTADTGVGNPVEQFNWDLVIVNTNPTTIPAAVVATFEIDYFAIWSDPKVPNQS